MSVRLDMITDAQLVEEFGETVSARRSALVTVSKSAEGGVLFAAKSEPGVPQPDEALNDSLPEVRVVRRECRVVGLDADNAKVEVLIDYEIQRDESEETHSIGASLQQITTQLDHNGTPITVEHNGDTQGGEITVLVPQGTIRYRKSIATNDPVSVQKLWLGKVNADVWQGGQPGTWLCTNVDADPKYITTDAGETRRYYFDFEFEYNPDGWDPTVTYTDAEGKIPSGIVDGVGIKSIPWYTSDAKNFAPDFPATG